MTFKHTQTAMRTFLRTLNSDDQWQLIGRTFYRRGTYGTFKLDLWSGGSMGSIGGLTGTFTPHSGGASDTIDFRFDDLVNPTNPTNNPNWQGEGVCGNTRDWSWHIAQPESMHDFQHAIDEWTLLHELTDKDMDALVKEANRAPVRRKVR